MRKNWQFLPFLAPTFSTNIKKMCGHCHGLPPFLGVKGQGMTLI